MKTMIKEQIKQNIIKELGIENLSEEKAEEVIARLEENIQRTLVLEALDLLKVDDQQEFLEIIKTKNDEKIFSFLESRIANFDFLIKAVAESVIKEFKFFIK